MIKKIPAKFIYECDRCHTEYEGNYTQQCGMNLEGESWAKGLMGDVGGSKVEYNFCGSCTQNFWEWLKVNGQKEVI